MPTKQELINAALAEESSSRTTEAEKEFKAKVRSAITRIEQCSYDLRKAKEDLQNLDYDAPADLSSEEFV